MSWLGFVRINIFRQKSFHHPSFFVTCCHQMFSTWKSCAHSAQTVVFYIIACTCWCSVGSHVQLPSYALPTFLWFRVQSSIPSAYCIAGIHYSWPMSQLSKWGSFMNKATFWSHKFDISFRSILVWNYLVQFKSAWSICDLFSKLFWFG